jgi:uncharacterized protein (TIGR03790 family)
MRLPRFAVLLVLCIAAPAVALGPNDVWIITNRNVPESKDVADYYCQKRGVPADHVLAFDLPKIEDINRRDYDAKLAGPLREALKDKRDQVKVLLTVYGVPLRVGPQEPNKDEKAELDKLQKEMEPLQKRQREVQDDIKWIEDIAGKDATAREALNHGVCIRQRNELAEKLRPLEERRRHLSYAESQAAVDSELSLLWHEGYELRRWQLNLLYFQVTDEMRKGKLPMVMTCRLDGPTPALVKRLIDDAIAVEAKGLTGKAYFDARGIKYDPKADTGWGYGGYDESLREAARLLEKSANLPVVLDDKPELFAVGACTDCALYCGWYSHANFVDCCRFVPGAVAYHIASSEAVSLRNPNSKLWCKNLLEKGAVATLGPVAEPYTIGFPKPAEFFGFLVTGEYTLVESYWRSTILTSWMTTLVGDPLYNPYAKTPKLKPEQVKASPEGGRLPFGK